MTKSSSDRPSSPVDIPGRKHKSQIRISKEARSESVKSISDIQPSKSAKSKHDPRRVRPAVAALLAMTSIPPPQVQQNRRKKQQRQQQRPSRSTSHVTIDELVEEWKSEDSIRAASAESKSPLSASLMNALLEPPRPLPHIPHTRSCSSERGIIATSKDKLNSKYANEIGDAAGMRTSRGRSVRTSSTTSRETNVSALSTSSCTSLEMSLSSNSLSSLLDGDAERERDDEGLLSPSLLSIGGSSMPASPRHQCGSIKGRRVSIEKKELLSPPAAKSVKDHPLLDCSRKSRLAMDADLKTANMCDGTDCAGEKAAVDTINTVTSANLHPTTKPSSTKKRNNPATIDLRNASTIAQDRLSDYSSSFTTLTASFKSNLTASFNALASAARSFSNFTAPSLPPDDLLTRSLLAPNPSSVRHQPLHYPPARFPSEMRPKPIYGVPEPALRRYLNPGMGTTLSSSSSSSPSKASETGTKREEPGRAKTAKEVSRAVAEIPKAASARALPADLPSRQDFVRQVHQLENKDGNRHARKNDDKFNSDGISFGEYENCEEMIPLKPYGRSAPNSNNMTHPLRPQSQQYQQQQVLPSPPFSAPQITISMPRPREPRENSDFLRIVVLEMNMRRTGKLDAGATGKARIWLPPRQERGNCDGRTDDSVAGLNGTGGPGIADSDAKMMPMMIPRRWIGQVPSSSASASSASSSSTASTASTTQ